MHRLTACGSMQSGFGRVSIRTRCHQPHEDKQSEHTFSDRECNRAKAEGVGICLSPIAHPRLRIPEPFASWLVWVRVPTRKVGRAHFRQPSPALSLVGEVGTVQIIAVGRAEYIRDWLHDQPGYSDEYTHWIANISNECSRESKCPKPAAARHDTLGSSQPYDPRMLMTVRGQADGDAISADRAFKVSGTSR